jgi:hypothetical protein
VRLIATSQPEDRRGGVPSGKDVEPSGSDVSIAIGYTTCWNGRAWAWRAWFRGVQGDGIEEWALDAELRALEWLGRQGREPLAQVLRTSNGCAATTRPCIRVERPAHAFRLPAGDRPQSRRARVVRKWKPSCSAHS